MEKSNQVKPKTLRPRRGERGIAVVELAFTLPIFLVLVLGIVDFGLGLRSWISITNAAREGARIASIRAPCDEIRDQVKDTSGGLVTSDAQITISPADCVLTAGESVSVTVEYVYEPVTPLGGVLSLFGGNLPDSFTISSTSDMRVE